MWGCMFLVYPFLLWRLREYIYTLSCYHHQIGSMSCYPLFRVRSWNNGVRCMSFYILMYFFFRRGYRSGALCLGRVTVRPLRDRALVNFNHMCPIFGKAAGPLTRGARVMASMCPTVIDIALSCSFFENNSQPPQNKPAHLLLTQHIGRAQLSS